MPPALKKVMCAVGGGGGEAGTGTEIQYCINTTNVLLCHTLSFTYTTEKSYLDGTEQQECKKVFPDEAKIRNIISLTRLRGLISWPNVQKQVVCYRKDILNISTFDYSI